MIIIPINLTAISMFISDYKSNIISHTTISMFIRDYKPNIISHTTISMFISRKATRRYQCLSETINPISHTTISIFIRDYAHKPHKPHDQIHLMESTVFKIQSPGSKRNVELP